MKFFPVSLLGLAPVLLLAACSQELPPPPMVQVVVDRVSHDPYQPQMRYVGRLRAQEDVAIQAKVSGYLESRSFIEGERVKEGDVLYTLEASEYEAALASAKADLSSAVARQANAARNFKRGRELLPKGAISQSEMDELTALNLEADANIEAAKAKVASAEANLAFTKIKAPISGNIGRSLVSPGDLVGPTTGSLTTLVSVDPIQALFQLSERAYVEAMDKYLHDDPSIESLSNIEVLLELTNGLLYPDVGKIDYISNRVDDATGTVEARALIPNPHRLLVPGQYVRVILQNTVLEEGDFVPQAAVQADQQGPFVLVVNDEDVIERRNIDVGDRVESRLQVNNGVTVGERVIVRGLQQVRAGMTVGVTEVSSSGQASSAPASDKQSSDNQ